MRTHSSVGGFSTLTQPRVWFPIHRIGPYHHARFEQASSRLSLTVIETRPASQEYPWDPIAPGHYAVEQLPPAGNPEADPNLAMIDHHLRQLLARLGIPDALVCMGWGDRFSRRLLRLARTLKVPVVLVSDSRWRDHPRQWPQEWCKRQLLRQASAALVAGCESRAYLEQLGFPAPAIFEPWDVVDNHWLARSTASAPHQPLSLGPHFLCLSRLVAKKNHLGLLQAYGRYQARGGSWGLRLVGSGPMETQIREAIARLPRPDQVWLEPFQQAESLPLIYRQASAFVLASHSDQWGLVVNEAMAAGCPVLVSRGCGCAADLVQHGHTGWLFEPDQPDQLACLMLELEALPPHRRQQYALAARLGLQHFSLESFASALADAVAFARRHPRHSLRAALVAAALS